MNCNFRCRLVLELREFPKLCFLFLNFEISQSSKTFPRQDEHRNTTRFYA